MSRKAAIVRRDVDQKLGLAPLSASGRQVGTFRLPGGASYKLAVMMAADDPYRKAISLSGGQDSDWRLCLAMLRPGDVFFDVGANVGAFAIPAGVHGAEVHAFELLYDNVGCILDSVAQNAIDKIWVTHGAVWDRAGAVGFDGHSAWGTVKPSARTLVAALRLDDYVAQHGIGRVAMMKLDVEGAEKAALAGAADLIARDHPDILFESNTLTCGYSGYSYRELFRVLTQAGYRLFRVGADVLHPWAEDDVQELVVADYLATIRSDAEITAQCGWPIQTMPLEQRITTLLAQEHCGEPHRIHVLAIADQLLDPARSDERVVRLLKSLEGLRSNALMGTLLAGTRPCL